MNFRECTLVQWFYRRFICPKNGHFWKTWKAFGMEQNPYCCNCSERQEGWIPPLEKEFAWRIKDEDASARNIR